MTIEILPQKISDQIAAGEVVERPASVVKELVENSIDANATEIEIFIENGGKTLIKVIDNGIGMNKSDLEKSVLRHATSKIVSVDDLFSIQSFGFRGEALAAVASVSDFEILTKTLLEKEAYEIKVKAGERVSLAIASGNIGTTISIHNLFYPTPARLQYLKNDATEYRNILKEIYGFALGQPNIGFKVYKETKCAIDYPAEKTLEARVKKVLSKFSNNLIPLESSFPGFKVSGFITTPQSGVGNRNHQYILVNNRRIEDHKLAYALREGYVQSAGIEKHLYPSFVLKIDIDPILVDVNVHPRKLEVKFAEPGEIFMGVKGATIQALDKFSNTSRNSVSEGVFPQTRFQKHSTFSQASAGNRFNKNIGSPLPSFSDRSSSKNNSFDFIAKTQTSGAEEPIPDFLRVIGQIANKYIVAESGDGTYFFDQHALHERQRFEIFWQEYKAAPLTYQDLLIPQTVTFSEAEIIIFSENKKVLESLKFKVNFPTDSSIEVLAVPQVVSEEPLGMILEKLLVFFQSEKIGENALDQVIRSLLEYKSCRGAVMFGDKLAFEEMEKIIHDFHKTDWKLLCPHGRPNHWFIPFEELDKKFHR